MDVDSSYKVHLAVDFLFTQSGNEPQFVNQD